MYTKYFGLKEPAFSITPDPRFLYLSEDHREALAHLLYGAGEGGGFVLLTGEVGTGKTTVCRTFLEQLPQAVDVALILNPPRTVPDLLYAICEEFGIPVSIATESPRELMAKLNRYLLEAHARIRRPVLLIDEAQNLGPDVLEQIRLLTNLETHTHKLLQIFLVGQPELRDQLATRELRQISQRITARYHLLPLSRRETSDYVAHRLAVAGVERALFTGGALKRVHKLSGGIPRIINILCDRALLGAYATRRPVVNRRIVNKAAGELMEKRSRANFNKPLTGTVLLFLLVGGGVLLYSWKESTVPDDTVLPAAATTVLPETAVSEQRIETVPPPAESGKSEEAPAAAEESDMVDGAPEDSVDPVITAEPAKQPDLESMSMSELTGMKELLALWGLEPKEPGSLEDPCSYALTRGLRCRKSMGGWKKIGRYNRPVLIELEDKQGSSYALVTGLGPQYAQLSRGGASTVIPLLTITPRWQGRFLFLWKTPPGGDILIGPGSTGAEVHWLYKTLSRHTGAAMKSTFVDRFDDVLRESVLRFQRQRGLEADGLAGPETIIELNTVGGSPDIPRLEQTR
ncbi:MAG: AAA family ATPase [Chromatiaceae bacterium]|nr:AAA family ATPase [Chromatiaceae bacterium]